MKQKLTQRETIIKVLELSIELGKDVKYENVRYWFNNTNPTYDNFQKALMKESKEKIELFKNVPDESATYRIILHHAKKGLASLKEGLFCFNCAELINIFLSLEPIFVNKVKFIGAQEIEESFKQKDTVVQKVELPKPATDKEIILKPGITGNKLVKNKEKEEEFSEALKDADTLEI